MVMEILLLVGILYPAWYDTSQLIKSGIHEYLQDPFNISDQIYIWASIANVVLQNTTDSQSIWNKILMTIILL